MVFHALTRKWFSIPLFLMLLGPLRFGFFGGRQLRTRIQQIPQTLEFLAKPFNFNGLLPYQRQKAFQAFVIRRHQRQEMKFAGVTQLGCFPTGDNPTNPMPLTFEKAS
jgi:hypothetical protein